MLYDEACRARATADRTGDPGDEAYADAREAELDAAARQLLTELREEADLTGLPTPASAGYASEIRIPPGAAGN